MSAAGGRPQLSRVDRDYRKMALEVWKLNGERLKFTSQIQADYGKWLIVTIATIHTAAIYAVSQSSMPEAVRVNQWSYWPFVIGISLILVTGLLTWFNWSLISTIYNAWMQPLMLTDRSHWPKDAPKWKDWAMITTWYGALFTGLLSAACIPWGAYEALHSPPIRTEQPAPLAIKFASPPITVVNALPAVTATNPTPPPANPVAFGKGQK